MKKKDSEKTKLANAGFSLVELIIVIAIMAIIVGIAAPQLIKYIEKSKVTADLRTMDAIYQALIYAANDPDVVQEDASVAVIDSMKSAVTLESLDGDTLFAREFKNSMDWDKIEQSEYEKLFTSTHKSGLEIYVQYKGSVMNPICMWATYTDATGQRKPDYAPSGWDDPNIDKVIVIR
ncbi:MAG: prepilin-type N-terminal cleavage/methylation domain-containing protein [Lachnospiraceae bacterium]|nr:prepilin-type N-terminal cleavage/methylation domain-containing protein [Lachnospiraceae bacterium]